MIVNKHLLARMKRVAIQTALVEANCAHNTDIRDIVTKYASHEGIITRLNFAATMRWIHERPQQFVDAACGWYWCNVARTYKGKAISVIFDERHKITAHYSKHLFN